MSYYVYIITNKSNKVLYTGMTSNLQKRIFEHRNKSLEGFTKKYNLNKLVYFEDFLDVNDVIASEKRIKGWLRRKKIELVEGKNPNWNDLTK